MVVNGRQRYLVIQDLNKYVREVILPMPKWLIDYVCNLSRYEPFIRLRKSSYNREPDEAHISKDKIVDTLYRELYWITKCTKSRQISHERQCKIFIYYRDTIVGMVVNVRN